MKKWMLLPLALALCLCLSAAALAEVTLTELGTLEDADWIADSNLLTVRTKDGYRVCDVTGKPLTADAYAGGFSYAYGYVTAALVDGGLNGSGLIDRTGAAVMPHQYGDIEVLSADWALGVKLKEATADNYDYTSWTDSSAYYLIETVDVYSLARRACVASLPREHFKDADVAANVINIEDRATGVITSYDADFTALGAVDYTWEDEFATPELTTFRENGQYGLKDAAGSVVMAPSFYAIYDFYGDYAEVSTGEKSGLIDRAGNVVLPAVYDEIKRGYYCPYDDRYGQTGYQSAGYFAVVADGKLGFANAQGDVTCEPKYAEQIMELYGASAEYTDMENNTHLLAADGTDTVLSGYENLSCMDGSAGMLFRVTNADYDYGLIDWHGEEILPCAYDDIELSGDGRYLLVRSDYSAPTTLYEVAFESAQPAPEASATEAPADGAQAADAPAAQAPAAGSADAKALVDSAITLLETDAAANAATAVVLLDSAQALTGDVSVQTILTSAKTLIEADAAANAAAAVTLLRSAQTLL